MTITNRPFLKILPVLGFAAAILAGCQVAQTPPPAPPVAVSQPKQKSIVMPREKIESHGRLSPTAQANIQQILDMARSANGSVSIQCPPKAPKAVIRTLKKMGVEAEKNDLRQDYEIIVTKPSDPGARQ